MIRSYRFRRLFAPTVALTKAVATLILGLCIFAIGVGFGFRQLLNPLVTRFADLMHTTVGQFVNAADIDVTIHVIALFFLFGGVLVSYKGLTGALRHIVETLNPSLKTGKVDVYMKRQQLAEGPRVVAIGGGTGLSTLLRGWKQHTSNITAIVCVSDDGGSSGSLRRDKSMIPPGDIRNCLVALADAERSMTDLFQHRFKNDSGPLSGHSMGNLLIAALVDQHHGDFEKAVETASDVLNIRGRVLPATLTHVRLKAQLEGGVEITGETAIVEARRTIKKMMLEPADCRPTHDVIDSILDADVICIGPGSVYTSIIPNLLVPGIVEAIRESNALKVYLCNVMTQPGETEGMTASQHVRAIIDHVDKRPFDYVMVNSKRPSEESVTKYNESGQLFVEPDIDQIRSMGFRVIQGDFISESDFVRHDPIKAVARLMQMLTR